MIRNVVVGTVNEGVDPVEVENALQALRELRVDRIWEGTSEIQRLIVTRGLQRRGVEAMLH